jgi:hypothetical protein
MEEGRGDRCACNSSTTEINHWSRPAHSHQLSSKLACNLYVKMLQGIAATPQPSEGSDGESQSYINSIDGLMIQGSRPGIPTVMNLRTFWFLQVGKAFADDDDIIIAKMDATLNDVVSPKFSVRFSYPLHYHTVEKNPLVRSGG